jgi:hypothetical protein
MVIPSGQNYDTGLASGEWFLFKALKISLFFAPLLRQEREQATC